MTKAVDKDPPEVLARINEGLTFVDSIAWSMWRQLGSRELQIDDLKSAARETLVAAARSFDPDRGVPFRKWAALRMRGAMIDAARQTAVLPKKAFRMLKAIQAADRVHETALEAQATAPPKSPEEADAKLGDQLASAAMAAAIGFLAMRRSEAMETVATSDPSPESNATSAILVEQIRAHIGELPEQERLVLERIYFEDASLEDVAQALGLSKSWTSRIHTRAIETIAERMRD